MIILVDSREQLPFTFAQYGAETEVVGLPVGDYSLPGFEDRAAIERKNLEDLVACLMGDNRARFERELSKGRYFDMFYVVIEANLADVAEARYRSAMKPHSAMQSIIALGVRYQVPFLWCGSRPAAEYCTFWMLQKYLREIGERFKQATKAQRGQERGAVNE